RGAARDGASAAWLAHDPEKWVPVFGQDHAQRSMLITFEGKRVIVAGAARGIGHAIAAAFAENGGEVTACDRLFEELEHFAGPAKSGGGTIRAAKVDVTDKASIEAVVAQAGGTIDVLVYVAGGIRGQKQKPLEEV